MGKNLLILEIADDGCRIIPYSLPRCKFHHVFAYFFGHIKYALNCEMLLA